MCSYCKWEKVRDKCKVMLDDPDFSFAYSSLEGIQEWVELNEHVTESQEDAVENIANSVYGRM